ncbi:hypothetical protein RG963_01290 [Methanosarcina sp. Z-7115]|uniref:Uncharacterized protein n=1 Tax=Methanosarcina baikalica TaxID=3073890 RepID=A0ABU2CXI4_9EURY|nr:hypothetical protein [Methanosarcina sp. Z-7115]MDR7664439.1 hypothetical protein [Methanosarcina sp. Z-7115]
MHESNKNDLKNRFISKKIRKILKTLEARIFYLAPKNPVPESAGHLRGGK